MRSRSLLLQAPGRLTWIEEEVPPPGAGEVLIETTTGAVSLGTELPLVRGDARGSRPPRYPLMTGYESVGIVVDRGPGVRQLAIGDRVVATYGHRTHALVPATRAIPVPPEISDAVAVLTILSGDAATGVRKLGPPVDGPMLVTGAGTIGLLATFALAALGATAIDVVEPIAARRALAQTFGARATFAPTDIASIPDDYAGGLECSSHDAAFALLQARLRPGGRICILADGNREPLTLSPLFHERQLTVIGSSDCPDYHAHARWLFAIAPAAVPHLEALFDCRITAADLPGVMLDLARGARSAIKVLVDYTAFPTSS